MPTSGRPPLPRSGDWVSPNRSSGSPPLQKPLRGDSRQEEDDLFDPPPDLVCPITHEVFSDPVLNSAGQVTRSASRHISPQMAGCSLWLMLFEPLQSYSYEPFCCDRRSMRGPALSSIWRGTTQIPSQGRA